MDFLQIFVGSLLSSGLAAGAAVYLLKLALEKRLQKELEMMKSDLRKREAVEGAAFQQLLSFRARQLSDFYWPLYIGLQKDNVIWRRILDKRDAKDDLKRKIGGIIEREVVLPNHDKLVSLIENNLHLAEADAELERQLLAYIRHVAVYKAMRAAGEELTYPIAEGEVWPEGLFRAVERRMSEVRREYDRLLLKQEEGASATA